MKNIITGSNGFLGSHLIKRLDGEILKIPHNKIHSIKLPAFEMGFFLSSYGNMADQTDTAKTIKANITDLCDILDEAVKHQFKSFVFISTSSVKLRIQTTYSRCKKAAEEILLAYKEKYNLPITIIRPLSITGVGEQKQHLIPTLIRSCMTGETINFVREPKHDFIDVDDVIEGILSLSSHDTGGIFELGSGVSYSNQEVLELVEKVTDKKANVNIVPSLRSYDTTQWVSQNFRARGFGWLPRITLEQSITNMVKEYKDGIA